MIYSAADLGITIDLDNENRPGAVPQLLVGDYWEDYPNQPAPGKLDVNSLEPGSYRFVLKPKSAA